MIDAGKFKQFIYSQHAYSGLRMAIGTVLPGAVLIVFFNLPLQGISCALGAFCISLIDLPAPLWRKHRHMLFGTLLMAFVSALTMVAMPHFIALWMVLIGVCFVAGLTAGYGALATAMGIAAMLAVSMMLSQRNSDLDSWRFLTWLVLGGVWYTYFCLMMCRIFQTQMARRSLADCMFATAEYLNARSQCYIPEIPLEKCYRDMIKTQVAVIETQQESRNLVLANMFVGRRMVVEPRRIRLFNIMTDIIDMHDSVLAMQVNFESLRHDFEQTDAHEFMRDLLRKTAQELCRVAEAVVAGVQPMFHFTVKAELRALEYEVQLAKGTEVEAVLELAYKRGRTIASMMEKLIQDLTSTTNTSELSLEVIEKKYFQPASSWKGFQWSIPGLRYALRLSLAVAFGMAVSEFIGGHSIWIVITIMVVLRPGFGLTQQRNKYRLIGTLLGCVAIQGVLWTVHQPTSLFWIMTVSFLLLFCFLRLNYLVSVFFATVGILLLYHFMSPQAALVGQRAIDTLIGTCIGGIAGYLFPTWEYQLIAPQVAAVLKSCRRYCNRVFAPVLDAVEYRLARRDALIALTALSASYHRMLLEPVANQVQIQELSEVVVQSNILVSEIASLSYMRHENAELTDAPVFQSVAEVVDATLTGAAVEPVDVARMDGYDVLISMQKSALNILQFSSALTLPGMQSAFKSVRAAQSGQSDL
jgi:uncharacterized membrane protein YccC